MSYLSLHQSDYYLSRYVPHESPVVDVRLSIDPQSSMPSTAVNAVTKAHVKGKEKPVLLLIHYTALVNNKNMSKLLLQPFQAMQHGVTEGLT